MSTILNPSYRENMNRLFMSLSLVGVSVAALCGGCHYLNVKVGLPDDNIFEDSIEFIIERQTGLEIDLTPEE